MKLRSTIFVFTLAVFVIATAVSCRRAGKADAGSAGANLTGLPVDARFSEYIASCSSGIMPSNGTIEIKLMPEFAAAASKVKPERLFSFNPLIKGKAEWVNDHTIVFKPSGILTPGTVYQASFNLGAVGDVPDKLKYFTFHFRTLRRDFRVTLGYPETTMTDDAVYSLSGNIITADYMSPKEVEDLIAIKDGRKVLTPEWEHPASGNNHHFTLQNIRRGNESRTISIAWDGTGAKIKKKGSQEIPIPAINMFSVLGIWFYPDESRQIDIILSDPPDPSQETEGLISVTPSVNLGFERRGNIISAFPAGRMDGDITLSIEQGLRNHKGITLKERYTLSHSYTPVPPEIKVAGEGIIAPSGDGNIFSFRAVNLAAVDLTIIKIFSNNTPYFLQMNDIGGSGSIRLYGRPVFRGKIDLQPADLNKGSLYAIDLSEFVKIEPGSIYRIHLAMRRSYSLYPGAAEGEESVYEKMIAAIDQNNWWDNEEDYWYESPEESLFYQYAYNWNERDNPCSVAYYSPDRNLSRNFLASNIGLIAKSGSDNTVLVMTSDIVSAGAMSDVTLEIFDMQMQRLGTAISDKSGFAAISCERKPFLLVASTGGDRNYLRLNDASSLSMSSFDVAGTSPEKGLKAFMYGERGIWRPGDSIYLSVFIKELNRNIPQDHPVQFELLDPDNRRVDYQVTTVGGRDMLTFITRTPPDARTGNYHANMRIGGANFSKRIRIETIKPNRLKIDMSFDNIILGGNIKTNRASLSAKWLTGAGTGSLQTRVDMMLKPVKTSFRGYSQYIFDCPVTNFYSETQTIYDGRTDEKGTASFNITPPEDIRPPGMLNALFTTRVFEKGGDASIIQNSVPYAAFPAFVGIAFPGLEGSSRILTTDTDNEIKLVTVDHLGRPISSQIDISIYKLSYRWWWESGEEQLGYYVSNNYYKPVFTERIKTSSGGDAKTSFNISGNEWGRYLIRAAIPGGHVTGRILLIDWPWGYGIKHGGGEAATVLAMSADKEIYSPGDNISISFPSPGNARAIVTVENATGVIDHFSITTQSPNTSISIKARHDMAPNIFVYVSVIQPHEQSGNDLPIRLYGVIPVTVEDPETRLQPVITAAGEIRSGRNFEVSIAEATGKAMNYTLAIVDEGLLDITSFSTPNAWNYFYAREALGVRTWDVYDQILGAFGGRLERVFATGGDEALPDRSAQKINRFRPVVRFIGPVSLSPGKTNTHKISMPSYTGAVRVMAVAGSSGAYGSAEKRVLVRDPLMILATAPRILSPGDKVSLPITIFLQDEKIRNVKIVATGSEGIIFDEKVISLTGLTTGENDFSLAFEVTDKTGHGEISISAEGGGEKASYAFDVDIRLASQPETRSELAVLRQGDKKEMRFEPFGVEGSNSAFMEISAMPSVNLGKRLSWLTTYPHGCTEQIISAAFPQLYLRHVTTDNDDLAARASANVPACIEMLTSRQMTGGGLPQWPGSAYQPDAWISSYAGHFMIEAARNGYSISAGFMKRWQDYQAKEAQQWRWDPAYRQTATVQAYRLFTLALAGSPEKGAMNRLREISMKPSTARWFLAAAYALSGRPEAAMELITLTGKSPDDEPDYLNYGSLLRDKAVKLYTLVLLKNEEQALILLREICNDLAGDEWHNTHSTAWGLFAWMKYAEAHGGTTTENSRFTLTLNSIKTDGEISGNHIFRKPVDQLKTSNNVITENKSEGPLYVSLIMKGVPPPENTTRVNRNLDMQVEYTSMEGIPINHTGMTQGEDFMMILRVTNKTRADVRNIALTQIIPSGWEIRNTRLFEAALDVRESPFDYRDFRDDRVYTYFGLGPDETKTFVVLLNASYQGEFLHPAIWCEAMYDNNYYSRIPGTKVRVKPNTQ